MLQQVHGKSRYNFITHQYDSIKYMKMHLELVIIVTLSKLKKIIFTNNDIFGVSSVALKGHRSNE